MFNMQNKSSDGNTYSVVYGGIVDINYFVNNRLMEQSKQLKRKFSNDFKDWFINMKSKFDHGLPMHGDINDWWWVPAMRIHIPGVKIKGVDY